MFGTEHVENKLDTIRQAAIEVREKMILTNGGDKRTLAKIERIIRGTVYVKWMHRFAMIFFIVWAVAFLYLMWPYEKAMLLIPLGGAIGYAVCLTGVLFQIKRYRRTVSKAQDIIMYRNPEDTYQQSSGVLWQACQKIWSEDQKKSTLPEI